MNRVETIKLYLSRFFEVLSPGFLVNLRQVVVTDIPLVSFSFRFDDDLDSNLIVEIIRCACFYVFPKEIRTKGILVDNRGCGCVEVRFGLSEEEFLTIADAFKKNTDILNTKLSL